MLNDPKDGRIGIVNPTAIRAVRGHVTRFCQAKSDTTRIPRARRTVGGEPGTSG